MAEDQTRSILGTPGLLERRPLDLAPGDRIDRYRLIDVLGEGGFGVVWRAEQEQPVRREVAIKLIKPGMDSGAVLARFKAERQALAVMDHPCIAKVLDGGSTDRGLPYFVMELVRGETITRFCDRARLSVPERLRLFIDVCDAVQHAHMKGVIHRDLKPSNILVAADAEGVPRPKVIDFGIAKALSARVDATMFTAEGQMVGTPAYMSPEQALAGDGDIDTRSDVYSLGVVLYELLAGVLPFDPESLRSAGYAEIQRIIREVEPPRPSARLLDGASDEASRAMVAEARAMEFRHLQSSLRRELDWLVMRCIEKERSRRYSTAGDVADDVRRYLGNQPIEAGPPSALYRARKFARRNRVGVAAGSLVLVSLVLAAVGTTWGMLWAIDERDRAEDAEQIAQQRADDLELVAAFQASQLSGIDMRAMGHGFREGILGAFDDEMRRAGLGRDEIDRARLDLEAMLANVNFTTLSLSALDAHVFERARAAIDSDFADQPLIRASLLQTLAHTLRELGLHERALAPQTEALALRRDLLGDQHPDTLLSMGRMGAVLAVLGRLDEAEPYFVRAHDGMLRVRGPDHADTLGAQNNLGLLYVRQNRNAEAVPLLEQALAGQARVLGRDHIQTIRALDNLAYALSNLGRWDEAEAYRRESVARATRALGPDHLYTLSTIGDLANLLVNRGKYAEADDLLEDAITRSQGALGDLNPTTIHMLAHRGRLRLRSGDFSGAEPYLREAWERQVEFEGPDVPKSLVFLERLADCLVAQDKLGEAEPLCLAAQQAAPTRAAAERLARLYERWASLEPGEDRHAEEARRWRAQAASVPAPAPSN
ncbi:MAG: serine/threonine-protein kinase [Phycisphaerales bacterium]